MQRLNQNSATYLRPLPVGTPVLVECRVTSVGKGLALTSATFTDKRTGKIAVIGIHDKVQTDRPSSL